MNKQIILITAFLFLGIAPISHANLSDQDSNNIVAEIPSLSEEAPRAEEVHQASNMVNVPLLGARPYIGYCEDAYDRSLSEYRLCYQENRR